MDIGVPLLDLDDLEAAQVVQSHCQQKLDAAASQLETVWLEVVQQVTQMEFVPSLADAVKARNVLDLLEATLKLNADAAVPTLVQRLVFQASVLEEAWLVRKSMMEAVLEGNFDDIQMWSQQASVLGPRSRPASAPASRTGEPSSRACPSRADAARSSAKGQAKSLLGSWWKSWMGSKVKEGPDTQHPPGREDGPDRRERPNPPRAPTRERKEPREAFKGRILSQKLDSRESNLLVLGFATTAKPTADELKKAYKAMAMRWHPDRPHNRDRGVEATANFRAVKAAYDPCTEKKWTREICWDALELLQFDSEWLGILIADDQQLYWPMQDHQNIHKVINRMANQDGAVQVPNGI
eukprot:g28676.t1